MQQRSHLHCYCRSKKKEPTVEDLQQKMPPAALSHQREAQSCSFVIKGKQWHLCLCLLNKSFPIALCSVLVVLALECSYRTGW
ncbi:hypothetical protein SRHO_G00188590 [Serrasalmus rhombeus]